MPEAATLHDAAELTRFIETHYHASHRERLPELAALAAKVERVHAGKVGLPNGLSDLLRHMAGEMEMHMTKEELILFPAIRQGGQLGIETPISAMRADHDDHAREIAEIRALTGGLALPTGACRSWTALYHGLEDFVAELEEHIRIENEVLFPQFEPKG